MTEKNSPSPERTSELAKAKANLADMRAFRDVLADALPIHLFWKDRRGRFIYANSRFRNSLDRAWSDIAGKTDAEFYPAHLAEKYQADDQKVIETGVEYFDVEEHLSPDGQRRYVEVRKTPLRNDAGKIVGVQGAFRDVTEQRLIHRALGDAEARYYSLVESLPLATWSKDAEGRFVFCNAQFCRSVGRPLHEVVGKTDFDFFPKELAEKYKEDDDKVVSNGQVLECVESFQDDKGEEHYIQVFKAPLYNAQRRIVGTQGVFWDVTPQERAKLELEKAKRAAEEASTAKGQFLANMSHEIRTPLHGVIGMADLLAETELNDQQREYVSLIASSADGLLSVINDVLDFSKIEAGKLVLELRPFDVRDALHQMLRLLTVKAENKGVQLICRIAPETPEILVGDPDRLRQVIFNLVGNSVKFTERGEIVVDVHPIEVEKSSARMRFSVRDTGVGIPRAKQSSIFHAFEQADGSTTRRFGGTGLGLAISARLVELMGGKLELESKEGVGSNFFFSAKFETQPAPERGRGQKTRRLADVRALLIDEHAAHRETLRESLTSWGVEVEDALQGSAGIESLQAAVQAKRPFDVVLIDARLPDYDSLHLAKEIRDDARCGRPKIVLLASTGSAPKRSSLNQLSAAAVAKPVNPSSLYNVLAELLGQNGEPKPVTAQEEGDDEGAGPARALRVLLAEDAIVNQKLASGVLTKRGHRVVIAGDGKQAVELAQSQEFDVILMDVQMPEMDGLEATGVIRAWEADEGLPRRPILAMTAHAMQGDRERCLAAGMDGYLTKPIRPAALIREVESSADANQAESTQQPEIADPSQGDEQAVDWSEGLASTGGDEELLRDVIEAFLEDAPRQLTLLRKALNAANAKEVRRIAHGLKGALKQLGAGPAAKNAETLEQHGRDGTLTDSAVTLDVFEKQMDVVCRELAAGCRS